MTFNSAIPNNGIDGPITKNINSVVDFMSYFANELNMD
jgi:hypothetical protein